MGDAVLALFGAPVAHEDDASERRARGARYRGSRWEKHAPDILRRYGVAFDLRVGINTGTAVLAFVGDAIRTEYTAMGDTANVAARLQSAALPGTVLISADTHRLVHTQFDFKPRGLIEAKGKSEPLETFEVVAAKAVPGNARGLEGLSSPLVGRERETALLRDRYAALAQGRGAVVAVIGEAGLGKSRLIAESCASAHYDAASDRALTGSSARAISYAAADPLCIRGVSSAGRSSAASRPMPRRHCAKGSVLSSRGSRCRTRTPFLGTILAIDTEASRVALANLSGEAVVNGVAAAVVNVVKAAIHAGGGTRPQVIVMERVCTGPTRQRSN